MWSKAKPLVSKIYITTKGFPESEKFGLTSQIQRAAVSIVANIAEGAGRNTQKDFTNFLHISIAFSFELETLIEIAYDIQYLDFEHYENLIKEIHEIQAMINGFIQAVKARG